MSLINDALKKAQKQRTEGSTPATDLTTPAASTEPLHRVARREKPAGFRSQLLLIGGGAAAAVILLGLGAMFFFRPADKPTASPQPAPVAATPAPTPAAAAPATTPVAVPVAATPAAPLTLPVAAPAAATPAPAQPLNLPPVAANPTPTQTAPTAEPAASQYVIPTPTAGPAPVTATPAAAERPKASTRMIGMIDRYKVGGIRVAGAESKVLMNDKVYRINDIVDHELGIRLTGIEPKALTFEDARGAVYTRYF